MYIFFNFEVKYFILYIFLNNEIEKNDFLFYLNVDNMFKIKKKRKRKNGIFEN